MTAAKMSSGKNILLLCLIFGLWITSISANGPGVTSSPLVSTRYGQLQGKRVSVKGTDQAVDGYFGIPFAKPPIGALRFSPPKAAEPWNDVRDAAVYPAVCLQDMNMMRNIFAFWKMEIPLLTDSEDCLYLNVHTPADRERDARLPVMVWIHGGSLANGGATFYDGSALTAYENVVVVSVQYRLGILGFFSTGDDAAPGNWGFLDQVAALQWVQENIEHFGGDPGSVTIFGESAGGVSVSALILSPLSRGLFHKAISESGVALLPGLISTSPDVVTYLNNMVANLSNCETTDSVARVDCMRTKTEEEIRNVALRSNLLYLPAIVDGIFLPKTPDELLAAQEYHPVPYVIGVNKQECGWLIPAAMMNISVRRQGMDKDSAVASLNKLPMGLRSEYTHLLVDEYMGDTEDPVEVRDRFIELLGDAIFVFPSVKTARLYRESGHPVYVYEFQHRPTIYGDSRPDFVKSDHGDEISFVLGGPFLNNDVHMIGIATDEEKGLSRTVMKYWANFARNGNPNGDGLLEWPAYDLDERYLEINLQQKIGKQLRDQRITFWSQILPEKINAITKEKKKHTEL